MFLLGPPEPPPPPLPGNARSLFLGLGAAPTDEAEDVGSIEDRNVEQKLTNDHK